MLREIQIPLVSILFSFTNARIGEFQTFGSQWVIASLQFKYGTLALYSAESSRKYEISNSMYLMSGPFRYDHPLPVVRHRESLGGSRGRPREIYDHEPYLRKRPAWQNTGPQATTAFGLATVFGAKNRERR